MALAFGCLRNFFIVLLLSTDLVQNVPRKSSKLSLAKTSSNKFNDGVLARHNTYRAKHRAPNLKLNKQICDYSQQWADNLAKTDSFKHRPNNKYGENLYFSWSSNPKFEVTPNAAVDAWYAEVKHYNYSKTSNISLTGHFTQLIWKNSKELGVGIAKSKTNRIYVVCNYSPPGNVIGQFTQNVLPPKCK